MIREKHVTPLPEHAPADPDRSAYLAYCADIEPMVRLTLIGSPSQIRDRCRTKAQAKRVVRELMAVRDGNPALGEIQSEMKKPWSPEDYDLGDQMAEQVDQWARVIRSALPGTDTARVAWIACGDAPSLAAQMTGSAWFMKPEAIKPGVRRHLAVANRVTDSRAERLRAAPSDREDAYAGAI